MARPPPSGASGRLAPIFDHRSGGLLVGHDTQDVARGRYLGETQDDRRTRATLLDALAVAVLEGADAAVRLATTTTSPTLSVPVWTSTVATGPRPLSSSASTTVPDCRALRVGLQLLDVGDDLDRVDQVVDALARARRDGHQRRVAAVLLDDHAVL